METQVLRKLQLGEKIPRETGFAKMIADLIRPVADENVKPHARQRVVGGRRKVEAQARQLAKKARTKYEEEMYQLHLAERIRAAQRKVQRQGEELIRRLQEKMT